MPPTNPAIPTHSPKLTPSGVACLSQEELTLKQQKKETKHIPKQVLNVSPSSYSYVHT